MTSAVSVVVIDWTGIYKADIGLRDGLIHAIGKAGQPADGSFYAQWEASPYADAYLGEMAAEAVKEGSMPPSNYTWLGLHKAANLTPKERQQLALWQQQFHEEQTQGREALDAERATVEQELGLLEVVELRDLGRRIQQCRAERVRQNNRAVKRWSIRWSGRR